MTTNSRPTRFAAILIIGIVIPLGLFARSRRSGADPSTVGGFLANYAGDTLWPVMFFFLARFVFPMASRRNIAIGVLTLTLGLEFGQLCRLDVLQQLRQWPVIGFLLGNTFLWSDVGCLIVGTALAVLLDVALQSTLDRRLPSRPA